MKSFYFQWKIYALSLILILFAFAGLSAQVREGVVRVKLTEEKANYLQSAQMSKSSEGYITSGDVALDKALSSSKAYSMKRVFRQGGKFETKHRKYGLHLWYEITFSKSTKVQTAIANFAGVKEVQISEPVYDKAIIGYNALNAKPVSLNTEADDPQYVSQWHYNNTGQTGGTAGADISAPQAWNIETGNSDVIVAVTDGGIDVGHEDLAANMWVNTGEIPGNGIDDDGNGYVDDINGYGFGDNSGTIPGDTHGTHVGGTVAAVTNNGIGVAGVAGGDGSGDGVRLMSCAAFGEFSSGGFAETYIYAADMGAVISQNSWGYTSSGVFEQSVLDAIDYFIAEAGFDEMGNPVGPMQGGVVIFAAGNDGTDGDWYPGIYEPIVAVGGTDHNDDEYIFSNRGDWVDLAAPAVNVLSTLPNDSYGTLTGTSMACPHVSGVAGLIISQSSGNITPTQVRARLEQTTDPLPGLEFLGTGRLNAFAALQQDDGVPPDAISDLAASDKDLSSVTLAWTAPADAGNGSATSYDIRYSMSEITAANFESATPVDTPPGASVSGTSETFTVSGLSSNTTYFFAIKSADFFGNESLISNVVNETTDEPPLASVNPSSMTSDLTTGETETQTLTITNSGAGPLTYDLSFGGTSFTPASAGSTDKVIKPHSKVMSSTKAYTASGAQTLAGDQYATGFEGLSIGDIEGQDGWSGSFEDWTVSTDNPYGGSQHLMSVSETLPSGSTQSLAFSPNVGVGSEVYSSTTAKLSVDNNGVSWQFIPQSPTAELIVTRVSFDADGSISIYDGGVNDFVSVPTTVPSGYFDLKLVIHRADFDMNLYINNELVYVGQAVTGDIEQVVLLSLMEQEGNEFSMDDFSIFDGEIDTYPFLSADVASGEVVGGSSQDIGITFNTAGLFGGTYQNEIQVKTNDPAHASFIVPATMNVTGTGTPIISVDPTSLEFDNTFIGGTSTLELEITNDGTEILNVSDITASADFGIDGETSITLLPFETTTINVEFSPSSLGAASGILTIANNDINNPSLEVPLLGNGVEAPAIAVTPSSFTEELEVGEVVNRTLTITNNGVADLEFEIEINEVDVLSSSVEINIPSNGNRGLSSSNDVKQKVIGDFAGRIFTSDVSLSSGSLNVLVLSPDDDVSDVQNTLASFPDLNISTYPKVDLPGITLTDLIAFDVVMTTNNTQWLAAGSVDPALIGDLLADYIDQGGKVIANCFAYDYDAWALEGRFIDEGYGPFSGTSTDFSGSTNLGTIHAPDHPVMEGVNTISNSYLWQNPVLASGATLLADWSDGNHFAAANENVVALNLLPSDGGGVPGWTGDLAVLYHNAILWLSGSGFVSADIESGVLAEGESIDVGITISAEGLGPGNHQATIDISSNDPANALVQVPVSTDVEGVAVTASPLSFNESLEQGQTTTETLTLSNAGTTDVSFSIQVDDLGLQEPAESVLSSRGFNPVEKRESAYSGELYEGTAAIIHADVNTFADIQYETGFEDFLFGDVNGQNGWAGQYGNWTIEDGNAQEGNLHFRGLSDGFGQSIAFSPVVAIGSDPISSVSMDVEIDGTGVTWDIIPQANTAGSVNTRLRFDPSGTVSVLVNDLGGVFVPTGATTPSGYFNVRIDVVRATSEFSIYFDNELIFEGLGFAGDIEQLVILSLMEVGGPTFDLDNVKIIDGASGEGSTPAISPSVLSGVIPAGGSTDIDVLFDGNRDYGTYRSDFVITLNDNPAIPAIVVEATLNVEGDPTIMVDPTVVQEVSDFNKMSTRTVTITNTGGNPLEYDLDVIGADIGVTTESMASKLEGITSQKDRILSTRVLEKMNNDKSITSQSSLLKKSGDKELFITIGDTFFNENFDGGTFPPTGWTTIDNEGNGVEWGFAADTGDGNYAGTGEAATINSDYAGAAEFDAELITPSINVEGRSNLALKYNVNYHNYAGLDFLDVDLSTDGGTTWSTLLSWNEDHGAFQALPGEAVSIPLDDAIAGASEIMVRWRYYDPNSGDWDWYAQIDDVEIVENSEVWLAVNEASGVVPVGGTAEVELTFDPTVVDPGFYVAGIIVNSNAVNTSQVGVVVSMQELNAAEIGVSPESLEQELVAGRSATQTLTIANTGESTLDFNFGSEFSNVGDVDESNSSSERASDVKRKGGTPSISGSAAFIAPNARAVVERDFAIEEPVDFSTVLYATNFETFAEGDILGQQGWSGQYVNWVIDASNPAGGGQHIRSVSDGLGQTLAFSPVVPRGTEPISSVSMMIDLQDTAVTWQIIPQSPTSGSVITRLSFDTDGTASALVADNGGEYQAILSDVPQGYFQVGIEVERATNMFTVTFDDVEVFSGEGFAGDIEQLALLSLMEVPGPTFDIDNVQLVDGVVPDPVLSASPMAGVVPSGSTFDVDITFNATNLEAGVYENDLVINNNDPLNSPLIVPTTLTVTAPQIIAVNPLELSETLSMGEMSTQNLTITNEGVADLIFDINVVGDLVIQDESHSDIETSKDWKSDAAKVAKKALDDEGSLTTDANTTSDVRSATVAIVYENFEGESFPPEGWSVVDNEGTGVEWGFASDYGEGNYAGTGEAATVSSDAAGTVEFDTELWTPQIEVDGGTGIVLEYVVNYQNLAGLDFLDVDISTDGGANWTTMLSWNEDHGSLFSGPGETVSLELDAFVAGAETFIVRWHYYDPNSGDWDWYAQIDDVVIGVPWLTVANADGVVPGGSSVDVEVNFDASSLQPGLFNTSLVVYSNDLKNPQVTVPASLYVLTPPSIAVEPETIDITLYEGFGTDASFAVSNSGETALEYSIGNVPGFVSVVSGANGTVEQDASSEVAIDVSAVGLVPGSYQEAIEIESNDPNTPIAQMVINLTVLEFVILDLEMATVCSDDPDAERRWEVTNPNSFDVDAFWFVVGSSVSDSITVAPGVNYFTSPTQTDRPNTVKLRWLDEDDVTNDVQVESGGAACLIENLNLTSMCSNNPDLFRRWRVRNPNPFEVMVTWNVVGTSQNGVIYAAGDNDTFFYTEAVAGANTTIIKWFDQDGVEQQKVKASSGEICDIDNSCVGGNVIAFTQGFKKNGQPIASNRSDASNASGYPEQGDGYNFVSLGFGGSIDIELNSIVVDQPGNDFVVVETSFRDANRSCEDYPESANVYVSENGTDYIFVGSTCRDGSFDIAEAGLMQIEFVRITDTSDPAMFGNGADGFDVDGIACINAYDSHATSFVMQAAAENNVPDEANEAGIVTFPNPFSERIAVKMNVEEDGTYDLIVHDLFGAEIYKGEITSSFGQLDAQIDAVGFANGTYMLTIVGKDNSVRVSHLMIKK